ncbi:MAG: multicopper oxidase domain-containing protein [Candidatus Omnitrophica bacterium]|nr:multicopper oxidase domain-containing protein [Candidatus Omnitrophota bacterium]
MKRVLLVGLFVVGITTISFAEARQTLNLPKLKEKAVLTFAPEVPPPLTRKQPALVVVNLHSGRKVIEIKPGVKYEYWTFNEGVPGPFIRVREGDTIEVHHTSSDEMGMPHNIDFHAVTGPGGGAPVTTVVKGEERIAWFKMLEPGLYIYHCAAPPVMDHIANGMYGLILVEPKKGLPKVDREYYVMQHEVYAVNPAAVKINAPDVMKGHNMAEEKEDDLWGDEVGEEAGPVMLQYSHQNGLDEHPMFVLFNGTVGSLMKDGSLKAKVGERIRVYFGNIGPNLISSFHIIGTIFKNVYREGDLISPPARSVQTTLVPAGGATVVDIDLSVPGTFTLVDHAIFRIEKGAVGYLEVEGKPNYDIYASDQDPVFCPGCLVHP